MVRMAPRTAVPEVMDRVSTNVSVGPTHGVQLRPNSTPSIGAPASPARGRNEGRRIRPVTGMRSKTPANSSPSTIVSTPRIWVSPVLQRHSTGLTQILGVLTIVLGLLFAGVFDRIPVTGRILRPSFRPRAGLAGAPMLGVLFGLSWPPCAGRS